MSDWVVNRLISFLLDNAAICEAAAAVIVDRRVSGNLSRLRSGALASARELADLQKRLGRAAVMSGTPQGTARSHAVLQLSTVAARPAPVALATALRSVNEAIQGCGRLSRVHLPPLVASAVAVVHGDLCVDRDQLDALVRETREGVSPREVKPRI
ncbi:MAG TPA: hypothetical protein VK943_16150 [Arenibaculum sp.]|nr:hypothetical protein [Arenibaculum sp.]